MQKLLAPGCLMDQLHEDTGGFAPTGITGLEKYVLS